MSLTILQQDAPLLSPTVLLILAVLLVLIIVILMLRGRRSGADVVQGDAQPEPTEAPIFTATTAPVLPTEVTDSPVVEILDQTAAPPVDAGGAASYPDTAAAAAPADDLAIIEGIGPYVVQLLNAEGITTFVQLAAAGPEQLHNICRAANLHMADPDTWSRQAQYAAQGDLDGLRAYQQTLRAGRD